MILAFIAFGLCADVLGSMLSVPDAHATTAEDLEYQIRRSERKIISAVEDVQSSIASEVWSAKSSIENHILLFFGD